MKAFDKDVFELMIEKVIIGEKEANGNINPRVIIFILKSGNEIKCQEDKNAIVKENLTVQKDKIADNLQQSTYESSENYLQTGCEPCGVLLGAMSQKLDKIVEFTAFEEFISFDKKGKNKVKRVGNQIKVTIEVDMVCGAV